MRINSLNTSNSLLSLAVALMCLFSALSKIAQGAENDSIVTIIEPTKKAVKVRSAAIDTEDFELGVFSGWLSVEDFATGSVKGLSLTYHINSKFIAQFSYAVSDVGRATFEKVVGGNFLSDKDREFQYFQAQAGYEVFHGSSFLGTKRKFNSHLYLIGGIENVDFAGNSGVGFVFGSRYKIVLTDWLTLDVDLQNHVFEREFIADEKVTNNMAFTIGFNALF